MRIVWFLLSLSFLFCCVFAQNSSVTSVPVATDLTTTASASEVSTTLILGVKTVKTAATSRTDPQTTQTGTSSAGPITHPGITDAPTTGTVPVEIATSTASPPLVTSTSIAVVKTGNEPTTSPAIVTTPSSSMPTTLQTGQPDLTKTSNLKVTTPKVPTPEVSTPKVPTPKVPTAKVPTLEVSTDSTAVRQSTTFSVDASTNRKEEQTTTPEQTTPVDSFVPATTPSAIILQKSALQTTTSMATTTNPDKTFKYSLNSKHQVEGDKELTELCKRLMANMDNGSCTLTWREQNGRKLFGAPVIEGIVKPNVIQQYYDEVSKKPTDNKTLIAILASCGALLVMIFILAICASHHRRPYKENQQQLTEEMQTVENGYHDNPMLDIMEVQPEMQEKKLNREFNDSWIVPIENLLKEDIPDEEDTHL
ncbi:podocalyxin isoform X2 [Cynoglossus semilaevis]|uniref:podocalyxin isoform X2 n=1 Tax=Cynoglossus semilaevis TaxID=244447 RepID=UPI000497B620|nr:podocalyxin isoform X2 [Cynoglossus semilaevis]